MEDSGTLAIVEIALAIKAAGIAGIGLVTMPKVK